MRLGFGEGKQIQPRILRIYTNFVRVDSCQIVRLVAEKEPGWKYH